jgi:hypothetical protein
VDFKSEWLAMLLLAAVAQEEGSQRRSRAGILSI